MWTVFELSLTLLWTVDGETIRDGMQVPPVLSVQVRLLLQAYLYVRMYICLSNQTASLFGKELTLNRQLQLVTYKQF